LFEETDKRIKIKSVFKKLIRDNKNVNFILRNILKTLTSIVRPLNNLTSFYRVFGNVNLNICNIDFKIYSESDDHIANELFYNQGYERSEFLLLKKLIGQSKYFIDVGANTGIFSIWTAKSNQKLKVYSFEPHPSNFNRLVKNASINKLTNIEMLPWALGGKISKIRFTIPADFSISATASANERFTKNFHKIDTNVSVSQTTIDEVFSQTPIRNTDIIKIDVEYYELEVLKGARSTLIIIEILQFENLVIQFPYMKGAINKYHASEIFDFLISLNYYCYSIEENGLKYIQC
jgi:FkbM family methyltransferase